LNSLDLFSFLDYDSSIRKKHLPSIQIYQGGTYHETRYPRLRIIRCARRRRRRSHLTQDRACHFQSPVGDGNYAGAGMRGIGAYRLHGESLVG
jgi:hypothetical protein